MNYPFELEDIKKCFDSREYNFIDTVIAKADSPPERIILGIIPIEGDTFIIAIHIEKKLKAIVILVENYMSLPLTDGISVQMLLYLFDQNRRLPFGRFEWNMASGELAYSLFLPVDDGIHKKTLSEYFESMLSLLSAKRKEIAKVQSSFETLQNK